jgi:hypothetical protein
MTRIYLVPAPPVAKFSLGALYVTTAADCVLVREDISRALVRHAKGDWGDLDEQDRQLNEEALGTHCRIFSVYHDRNKVKFWIITEADRSVTTVLLPDDY